MGDGSGVPDSASSGARPLTGPPSFRYDRGDSPPMDTDDSVPDSDDDDANVDGPLPLPRPLLRLPLLALVSSVARQQRGGQPMSAVGDDGRTPSGHPRQRHERRAMHRQTASLTCAVGTGRGQAHIAIEATKTPPSPLHRAASRKGTGGGGGAAHAPLGDIDGHNTTNTRRNPTHTTDAHSHPPDDDRA